MGNIPCPSQGHSQDPGRQGAVRLPREGECCPAHLGSGAAGWKGCVGCSAHQQSDSCLDYLRTEKWAVNLALLASRQPKTVRQINTSLHPSGAPLSCAGTFQTSCSRQEHKQVSAPSWGAVTPRGLCEGDSSPHFMLLAHSFPFLSPSCINLPIARVARFDLQHFLALSLPAQALPHQRGRRAASPSQPPRAPLSTSFPSQSSRWPQPQLLWRRSAAVPRGRTQPCARVGSAPACASSPAALSTAAAARNGAEKPQVSGGRTSSLPTMSIKSAGPCFGQANIGATRSGMGGLGHGAAAARPLRGGLAPAAPAPRGDRAAQIGNTLGISARDNSNRRGPAWP